MAIGPAVSVLEEYRSKGIELAEDHKRQNTYRKLFEWLQRQGYNEKTSRGYASAAIRFVLNPEAEIRQDYDKRALSLLLEWWMASYKVLLTTFKGVLMNDVAIAAIEHPEDLTGDHILPSQIMFERLNVAASALSNINTLDTDTARKLWALRYPQETWPLEEVSFCAE